MPWFESLEGPSTWKANWRRRKTDRQTDRELPSSLFCRKLSTTLTTGPCRLCVDKLRVRGGGGGFTWYNRRGPSVRTHWATTEINSLPPWLPSDSLHCPAVARVLNMWGKLTAKAMPSICCQSPWLQWLDLVSVMTKWVLSWPEHWEQEERWKVGNLFCRYWLLKAPLLVWWPYFISSRSQRGLEQNTLVALPYFAKLSLPPQILEKSIIYLFCVLYFSKMHAKIASIHLSGWWQQHPKHLVFLKHVEATEKHLFLFRMLGLWKAGNTRLGWLSVGIFSLTINFMRLLSMEK